MTSKPRVDPHLFEYILQNPDVYETPGKSLTTSNQAASDALKQHTILVIEDDDLLRRVVVHKLRKSGYTVIETASGNEALKLLQNHTGPIDLVLTDIIMPGMNGREVVAEIRRTRPTIAVLYMSGYPSDIVTMRGALEPGIDFLEKAEVIGNGLIDKIREILNRPI